MSIQPNENQEAINEAAGFVAELKGTLDRVMARYAAHMPQDPEDFVVLRGSTEALIERAEKRLHFGTGEEPAKVRAGQLVPGVYMEGHVFGVSWSVIVEKVIPQDDGTVWVTAYNSSAGKNYPERVWPADKQVETWGKL